MFFDDAMFERNEDKKDEVDLNIIVSEHILTDQVCYLLLCVLLHTCSKVDSFSIYLFSGIFFMTRVSQLGLKSQ